MAGRRNQPERERIVRLKDGSVLALPEGGEMPDFAQQLRDAIAQAGLTQYQLAKATGIPQSALSQFLNGKDLRLSTFNILAHQLGFQLRQDPQKAPRRQQ